MKSVAVIFLIAICIVSAMAKPQFGFGGSNSYANAGSSSFGGGFGGWPGYGGGFGGSSAYADAGSSSFGGGWGR